MTILLLYSPWAEPSGSGEGNLGGGSRVKLPRSFIKVSDESPLTLLGNFFYKPSEDSRIKVGLKVCEGSIGGVLKQNYSRVAQKKIKNIVPKKPKTPNSSKCW
jgi:hypothetical protein